ncbi:hypothetical protein HS088_TW22G01349 [Tripterygium wilfordii]|uniref:U-box domain-containing protein n=1 Tax=Tripterygium wilfordii TaxID=458696 RepID=A0A7J7C0K9_TRIWF|nr:U-box domain-containing protein 26-like [Tripterygium wilfordii]KAF5727653.1 hypothetical protein HS088_TW22G01349 [Tripterygium wilfordii]
MKEAEMSIPHLFRCPITLDLFKDPVTLCTGQTYDRSSIEKWISAGNLTCPVTMQKLNDPTMVPNHTLRHLIDQWLHMGQLHFDCDYLIKIDSLASLKQNLDSHEAKLETKLQSLEIIQVLTEESPSQVHSLLHFGFLDSLLELLFTKVESELSQEYTKLVEQTLCCVKRMLPFCELESLNMLKEKSRLESFLALFEHGSGMIKKSSCQLIEAIASSSETKELCAILGQTEKLLQGLVLLLHQNREESDSGIKAISALCSLELNRQNLVKEGVVDGLIAYISDAERRERSLAPRAMATLELLLGLESAKEALISSKDGIRMIVKMVFKVSDHEGSESAVKSLTIICNDSLKAREAAMAAGVLTQLLLLLQSQCSGRTKTKARMLLKLLRSKWVEDTKHL